MVLDELFVEGWKYATKCRVKGAKKHIKIQVLETKRNDCLYRQFGGYSEEKQPYRKTMGCDCSKKKNTFIHVKG